jgi:hypothetical protein
MAAAFFRMRSRLKRQSIRADREASLLQTLAVTEWELLVEQFTFSRLCFITA